ncbi:bifunctional alpha/beta hydrolase/class I SAM-dependent methyltransferase [Chitinolyticbacter albus]|uniref:bifunctional alpha/beta hydrolase/class I SAM-dependent methyltransferase n=1 Tax=Chitinolyticbacter albus TaxID=2961951 RepID=UPI0021092FF4|nr:bifunctional alpha/beta hydrolase/class I SAM-dependent methyltransferase [Chitinolyticbacter albus]
MRHAEERQFQTFDQQSLFYRHWPATEGSKPTRAIVLFHRGHEHSGRLQHIVDELNLPDVPMFAWDARGHGRSPGERGFSPSLATSVRDVDEFVRHAADIAGVPLDAVTVIAQSVGAVLVSTWVHDYAPKIRGMVLASPAFKVKLYVPLARPGLRLMEKLRGNFFVNSYVKAKFLTHDPERIASYESDPLITRPIASHILLALYEAADRVVADAGAITVPTQLLISGADWVVHHGPQHEFFERLGSTVKEKHVLDGFYHDTLGEKDRHLAFDKIRAFLDQLYAAAPVAPDLLAADRQGYTASEYRGLQQPLSPLSPKALYYGATRLNMRTLGSLSRGIKLGFDTGFDSGSTLDYVYRNRIEGTTPLGKLADKIYLDSVGWRGIRVRKQHLEQLITAAADALREAGTSIRVVDIAAGHGRYVIDALARIPDAEHILLRDYSPINVEAGGKLITERGLEGKASFVQGDAFDRDSLSSLSPRPTLAIVSGLYELFPDNPPILASLKGLADAVPAGGYLVYTNQPWHPQLELIARSLTSHRGHQPWVMRRRTQQEMDQLVEAAGFEKLTQRIDEWGVFTVSLARRKGEDTLPTTEAHSAVAA